MPLPEFLENVPEVELGNELYLRAFMELSSCRELGFGMEGPIPWNQIRDWCAFHDITGETRDDLFHLVKVLDLAFLRFSRNKARDAGKGGESGPGKVQREDAPDRSQGR